MAGLLLSSHRFVSALGGAISRVGTVITAPATSVTFELPAGSAAGDWCFMTLGQGISNSLGISGGDAANPWTYVTLSTRWAVAYKFLTAGDIGATFTVATANGFKYAGIVTYEGVTTAVLKGSAHNTSIMAVVPGFAHTPGGMVFSVLLGYRSYEADDSVAPSAGFTEFMDTNGEVPGASGVIAMADNASYNDADITWTNSGGAFARNGLYVFELT